MIQLSPRQQLGLLSALLSAHLILFALAPS